MPRGVTESPHRLQERRRIAFSMFTKGYTNSQVAEKLSVHPGTVTQYRQQYETELGEQVSNNPGLLRNVLRNTVSALTELDEVRRAAWHEYENAEVDVQVQCPHCETEFIAMKASSVTTRNQLLKTITTAQEQRAKLLGLFGVKAEVLFEIGLIKRVQDRVLDFMRRELCQTDKLKLEQMLMIEFGSVGAASQAPAVTEIGPALATHIEDDE